MRQIFFCEIMFLASDVFINTPFYSCILTDIDVNPAKEDP